MIRKWKDERSGTNLFTFLAGLQYYISIPPILLIMTKTLMMQRSDFSAQKWAMAAAVVPLHSLHIMYYSPLV